MFFKSRKSASKADDNPQSKTEAKVPKTEIANDAPARPDQTAEMGRRIKQSKHLQAAFGEVVTLLLRSPEFRNKSLRTLEHMVLPAIKTGQFLIAEGQHSKSGFVTPVAAILWASVSKDIDRQLSDRTAKPPTLDPQDWKSGDVPWLILAVGDQRLIRSLKESAEKTVLKGRTLKTRTVAESPTPEAVTATSH